MKLQLEAVSKMYRMNDQLVEVLRNVSIGVQEKQFVSIIGPSGSGKSTLFYIIGGLTLPSEGRVILDGIDVTGRRGQISYMPQNDSLFPWRTIVDNAVLSQEVAGISKREAREKAREWLPRVGLGGYEALLPHKLSGGMRQRVSFLRALLSPQEMMCLDEPFGALDALTRMDMQHWLLRIWEETRRSVLSVTHSIEEALLLSDRIYILAGRPGTIAAELDVPFGRPRDGSITSGRLFIEMKNQIYDLLRAAGGGGSGS